MSYSVSPRRMDFRSSRSYRDRMADTPRSIRINRHDWAELRATAPGNNRNQILRDLIRWYLGRPDAELPERTHLATPTCGHPDPSDPERLCSDVPHHYGVHDHLRHWWPNDSYPEGAGLCITKWCNLYNGHPGDHHILDQADDEPVDVPF